jgi:hypothetical protein
MTYFKRKWSSHRDANEADIINELQDRGAIVVVIDAPCDIVVGYRGTWTFVEIKSHAKARVRPGQKSFIQRCAIARLPCVLIDDLDDVDTWWPIDREWAPWTDPDPSDAA